MDRREVIEAFLLSKLAARKYVASLSCYSHRANSPSTFIFAHNHTSGDVIPSEADVSMTRRLRYALGHVDLSRARSLCRRQHRLFIRKSRREGCFRVCSFWATLVPLRVLQYQRRDGRRPLAEWLDGLSDQVARSRILARLDRLNAGLFGDWKSAGGDGVYELRIDHGPGYRVYYAQDADVLVLLLCGGNKRTQTKDIRTAHAYWKDYKTRTR